MTAPKSRFLIGDRLVVPSEWQYIHSMIAYNFTGSKIVCPKCALNYDLTEQRSIGQYPVNFGIYQQTCHDCGCIIAVGSCESQLFPKDEPTVGDEFIRLIGIGQSTNWWKQLLERQQEALCHTDEDDQAMIRINIQKIERIIQRKEAGR